MRARVVLSLAALALATALPAALAAARSEGELGTFERQALEQAQARRSRPLVIEPHPEGKTIAGIEVINLDVFSARDWWFQWFNRFHRTTRAFSLQRELLFAPGDAYRQEIIDETNRTLQNPTYSNVVVILALQSAVPGQVDVLVVTRDVWSLRLNTDFEIQEQKLLYFTASLAENNLFGWRKQLALVFAADQGVMSLGPTYVDPNIAGTRLTFSSSVNALLSRRGGDLEGSTASASIAYPLYSLASKWGAGIDISHANRVVRSFLGNDLRPVDLSAASTVASWPWVYGLRTFSVGSSVVRSFGHRVIQRVGASHSYSVVRPRFTADFPDDQAARDEFRRQVFPRSERVSALSLSYSVFTPRYRTYRDLDTFDLREDRRLGPNASASVSRAEKALGSDRNYFRLSAGAAWSFAALGGLQSVSVGWAARFEGGLIRDQSYSAGGYLATPVIAGKLRVIANLGTAVLLDPSQNSLYFLGGDNGLRGYTIGDLTGRAEVLGHLEVRSLAWEVASFRLGGLVFYDLGDAATPAVADGSGGAFSRAIRSVFALSPKNDIGAGIRLLIPQFNSYVLRADWAFALQSTAHTRAGWPGRISIGFRQVF